MILSGDAYADPSLPGARNKKPESLGSDRLLRVICRQSFNGYRNCSIGVAYVIEP